MKRSCFKLKKKEIIFFAAVLIIAAVLWIGMKVFRQNKDYGSIQITVNGREYGTYSLGKDQVISINETNVCEIKDGRATMIEANCPDQLCMSQPSITAEGGFIICLPNTVFIEGIPAADSEENGTAIDAVG